MIIPLPKLVSNSESESGLPRVIVTPDSEYAREDFLSKEKVIKSTSEKCFGRWVPLKNAP